MAETLNWVEQVLQHRAYLKGTLYYATAEQFLYFVARLMLISPSVDARLHDTFRQRVSERLGAEDDALALSMRILCAIAFDLNPALDLERLLELQQEDGSWRQSWFYKYGSTGMFIGNDGVTTALSVKAIEEARKWKCNQIP